jgi:hypothetical protein
VRLLSDATYAVYLSHLFFLYPLREWMAAPRRVFEPESIAVPWALSLLLSLAVVQLGRSLLGARSRTWIGA